MINVRVSHSENLIVGVRQNGFEAALPLPCSLPYPLLRMNSAGSTTMAHALDGVIHRIRAEEAELRRRGIRHLAVFGSVARSDDRPDSDVDIAVEIEPGKHFFLIRMEDTRLLLEDALGRPVDLGEVDSFRPPVRAAFDRERVPAF